MKPRHRMPREGGFTLIEVMVAALMLLVAMAGIVPFFLSGLNQASTVRYKSIATNIARERMEQVRQLDYREISDGDPEDAGIPTLDQLFGTTEEQRGVTFTVHCSVERSAYETGALKKVTIDVGWTAPPRVSAAQVTTLIHQQFLGPRISLLEVYPAKSDPLGSPFPCLRDQYIGESTATWLRCHVAQADWGLVYDNLDQAGMAPRDVYARVVLFDTNGVPVSLGDADDDFKITDLRNDKGDDGKVSDVYFHLDFQSTDIPDGYWEMRATLYNKYDEPGNTWRLRVRVENGPPAAPTDLTAVPQADNQTVVLTWFGGPERDRKYYVLQRQTWNGVTGVWVTTMETTLDPNATTFTDQGDAGATPPLDPWGTAETPNAYRYLLWAVDIADRVGPAAQVDTQIPDPVITTTTTSSSTTTTLGPTTTTTAFTTGSVVIKNSLNQTYNVVITYDSPSGTHTVYTGSVGSNSSITIPNLAAGWYHITASRTNGKQPKTASFQMPDQNGQVALEIS